MRTLMLSLSLMLASLSVASADGVSSARERVQAQQMKLDYESNLVVIADRDIQTARLEQDTARAELARAQAAHDSKQLALWSHRMETAHADEADAFQRYDVHVGLREDARKEFRVAAADMRQLDAQQARR